MAGSTMASTERKRHEYDNYSTPPDITQALLDSNWRPSKGATVWECAAGEGAMVDVLDVNGYSWIGTELRENTRADIIGGVDFLSNRPPETLRAYQIVTNPPFNLAEDFIRRAYDLEVDYLALLLKMTYWNAKTRLTLFDECQPLAVLPLTWRMDCTGQGSPTMDVAWYVWYPSAGKPHRTMFEPLPKGKVK